MNRVHELYYAEEQSPRDFKHLVQHYDDLTSPQARLKCKIKAWGAHPWPHQTRHTPVL